jgi:hypothetical protein
MRPCRTGSNSGTRIAFWATIVSRASCPRAASSQRARALRGARLRAALPAACRSSTVSRMSCSGAVVGRSRALVASRHESRFSRRLRPAAGRYLMETMPLVRRPRCRMHARRWVVNLQKPLALPWQTGVTRSERWPDPRCARVPRSGDSHQRGHYGRGGNAPECSVRSALVSQVFNRSWSG